MALTVNPEFNRELAEVRRHLDKFYSYAKADAAGWTDAQWNYLGELFNATALLHYAVDSLVKANQPQGNPGGISLRPTGLKR